MLSCRGLNLRLAAPVCAGLLTALASRVVEAAPNSDHGYQTWFSAFAHGPMKGNAWFWTDAHLRFYETFEPAAALLRPGVSWRARPKLFLTAGYGWTPSWKRPGDQLDFTDEHRAWQQIMWTPKSTTDGTSAILRGRLEQRFRPADHADTGLRLRFMWRGQVPLSRHRSVFFVLWDELFVAINEAQWGQRPGVDQNRLFVGVGWQVRPKIVRMELGYTNVWLTRDGPDPVNHVMALNTFFGWNPPERRRKSTRHQ